MAFESINLNIIPTGDKPVFHAAQYDVNRPIIINLFWGEDAYNVPEGVSLELQVRKVDNNIVTAAPDSVVTNVVTFLTTEQMTACSGTNLCEVQLTDGDDNSIATLQFYLVVQRDTLAGGLTSQSEIYNLEGQIAELVPEVIGDEYYTAAEVDAIVADIPTFDPSNYYTKSQLYTQTETNGLLAQKANTSSLATVATSGDYNDLSNKPTIPDVSNYYTKSETYNQIEVNNLLATKADSSSLSAVATSGDYDDLLNKPTIPAAQVNSDWDALSGVAQILNKPTIPTNAEDLPIESGSSTNTKDYIDGITNSFTIHSGTTATIYKQKAVKVGKSVNFNMSFSTTGAITSGTIILDYPSGFTPTADQYTGAYCYNDNKVYPLIINSSGISLFSGTSMPTNSTFTLNAFYYLG